MLRSWKAAIVCAIALVTARPALADELDPANTHAVIVGVLRYKHRKVLEGFPTKNRKDKELRDLLVKRGTPEKNIAFLKDKDATLEHIREAVTTTAKNAGPGSTLIVYYNGHGFPNDDGDIVFANYDAKKSGWSLKELGETIAKEFKGKRVILLADACYSGGLEETVDQLTEAKIPAVALTSCAADCEAVGTWTFTQSLLDGLNGNPLMDANGDGRITLNELATDIGESLRHRENQLSGFKSKGVADDFVVAKTTGAKPKAEKAKFAVGSYVKVRGRQQDPIGRVVGVKDGEYIVEFFDYSDKYTEEFAANELTASIDAPDCEVKWEDKWYVAKVLKTENDKYHVHYIGYKKSWDEWVSKERIRNLKN